MLVYNVRPQAMARLGLSYDDVRAANPRIIYVGAYGYSQRGPYAAKAAYDDLIQGAIGVPGWRRRPGRNPTLRADQSRRPADRTARGLRRDDRPVPA